MEFLFVDFKGNIGQPGLLLNCETLIALVDYFESVFKWLTLLNDLLRLWVQIGNHQLLQGRNAWVFHVRLYKKKEVNI